MKTTTIDPHDIHEGDSVHIGRGRVVWRVARLQRFLDGRIIADLIRPSSSSTTKAHQPRFRTVMLTDLRPAEQDL